jgi:hypothetical protein
MNDWIQEKRWSDRFLPEIKRILGEHLIAEPPVEEDAQRNTDLIAMRLEAIRIACRIRRHKYLAQYGSQFTFRSGVPSGVKTELTKIIEGWGDYFFYGFSNKTETALEQWILCDLKAFRVYFTRELVRRKGVMPGIPQSNKGDSNFMVFDYRVIPGFVIASAEKSCSIKGEHIWHLT